MKKIKIVSIFLIFLTLISTLLLPVNASGNSVSIITGPIGGTSFEIDVEITWAQYIKTYNPEKFHYNGYGVYWDEYRIYSDQGKTLIAYDDLIVPGVYYAISPCGKTHDWRDTRIVIQTPNCQRPLIIEEECSICLFNRERVDESFVSVDHSNVEIEHIPATCFNNGLIKYKCESCEEITEEILNQLNHRARPATCEEASICLYCKTLLEPAFGHDLRHGSWGKCMRDGCDERVIDVQGALSSVGTNISNWWQGGVSEPVNNGIENVKDWLSVKKEEVSDSAENIKQGFNTVLLIIFGVLIILVLVTILPLVIKFFDFLSDRKNKRGDKK